jgi:hyperosmotically inducible periplasmic protein
MTYQTTRKFWRIAIAAILTVTSAAAQQHRWAGRVLDDREWEVHEKLAVLPSHGVFDDIRFELRGDTVVLSGQVMKETVKQNAERAVRNIGGVSGVVNRIDVLPSSRRDDAIRMNVYRAIYEHAPLEKYGTRDSPGIHIIVKHEWVTLEGVVDSYEDRHAAHLRALHVTPHVTDNLRVAADEL